jgi:hypothetical protein
MCTSRCALFSCSTLDLLIATVTYLQALVDGVVAGDGGVGEVGAVELAGGGVADGLGGTARLLDLWVAWG